MYSTDSINPKQLSLDLNDFRLPFGGSLSLSNRWVQLRGIIPWADFEESYKEMFSERLGRKAKSFQIALGALLIQGRMKTSDRETVLQIQENPYLQFFLGLSEFQEEPLFDPSMLVYFRKRIGLTELQAINEAIILGELTGSSKPKKVAEDEILPNKGDLKIDATCTPADVRYPTDLSLLNEARENTERVVDKLWAQVDSKEGELKPRTYRNKARKDFLSFTKKKNGSKRTIKKSIQLQLSYLKRNLGTIDKLLKCFEDFSQPLDKKGFKSLVVASEIYRQQFEMFQTGTHRIDDRIVSFTQPYIRPIVRGKAGKNVEFGAKISVASIDGFVLLDRLEWDAFHEGEDLILHAEKFKALFGCWPKSIHADKAYTTRKNRKWCQEREINLHGAKLGRPKKETAENKEAIKLEKEKAKKSESERVEIEGKFGVAKRRYGAGKIMAKLKSTSESLIMLAILNVNLGKILANLSLSQIYTLLNLFKNQNPIYFNEKLVV